MAAFSVARPTPLPRAFLPRLRRRRRRRRSREDVAPGPIRLPGSLATADWFREPAPAVRAADPHRAVQRGHSRDGEASSCRTSWPKRSGASPGTIVVDGASRQRRNAAGRERQRVGHCDADPARAHVRRAARLPVRPACGRTTRSSFVSTDGGAFGGVRRRLVRRALPLSPTTSPGSSTSTRSAGSGQRSARVRRRHASRALRHLPADDRGAHRGADRAAACAAERAAAARSISASRSRCTSRRRSSTHGVAAVTLTTAGDNPPDPVDRHQRPAARQTSSARSGARAQDALGTLDEGLEFTQGTSTYLVSRLAPDPRVGDRARADRLSVAVPGSSSRSLRALPAAAHPARPAAARLPEPAWLLGLGRRASSSSSALLGAWPRRRRAADPAARARLAHRLAGEGAARARACSRSLGWLVARERLIPRRAITSEEELAGHTASLLCARRTLAARRRDEPFALVFLLPSLHVWLWLPQVRDAAASVQARRARRSGFAGPALSVRLASPWRFGLGWDAPSGISRSSARRRLRTVRRHAARWSSGCAGTAQLAALGHATLRAVSGCRRAAADAGRSAESCADGTRASQPPQAIGGDPTTCQSVGGLDATSSANHSGTLLIVAGALTLAWALARLAVAGPVHGALHDVEAAPARLAVRASASRRSRLRSRHAAVTDERASIAREAKRYRAELEARSGDRAHPRPAWA